MTGRMYLTELQIQVDAWCRHNFGETESLAIDALVVAEEVGELCRAVIKQHQGIRGSHEQWQAEMSKEAGDIVISLASFCANAGIDLGTAVAERWVVVGARDFTVDKVGHGMPS